MGNHDALAGPGKPISAEELAEWERLCAEDDGSYSYEYVDRIAREALPRLIERVRELEKLLYHDSGGESSFTMKDCTFNDAASPPQNTEPESK